ncbi:MAG: queuosine precursor transporter [Saprospiraceae bacterium]|nr:queuosine precursor transporter [Saprospiraceae bacterium]MCF8249688.1 queuosine precursor transporter [Saprospiraceae bacterium]MCF8279847.1 queuosine precursor transporter [Bacteroidales bacterium]MCF8312325.1 queuosine precursor transporter [Saprospiraceae bacterium]MCF8440678.1 queuosine precursor transporter [Saprospiraceae bacterium]
MKNFLSQKPVLLFVVLAGFFVTNAIVAEFIGVKIFALEDTIGIKQLSWKLFGQTGSLNLTAGVLLWPVVFIMTDLINEYFGKKSIKILSWLTAALIGYAFLMVFGAIKLVPADWWMVSAQNRGVADRQVAFSNIFGQGLWIIGGSLVAFLIGQVVDAGVFHKLRKITGESKLWLRATGSTLISQFIDSYVVIYIAFVLNPGEDWSINLFLAVSTVNYCYKFVVAILLTPVIYLVHNIIDWYLGHEVSEQLRHEARNH